jgi:conjugative transfer region protein TrbK
MIPRITPETAARVAAMAFVVLAIAATAVQIRHGDPKPAASSTSSTAAVEDDPLRAELKRCQLLGEAGAHDDDCLRAWAENRRRFLHLSTPAPQSPPAAMFPSAPSRDGATGDVSPHQPTPKGE